MPCWCSAVSDPKPPDRLLWGGGGAHAAKYCSHCSLPHLESAESRACDHNLTPAVLVRRFCFSIGGGSRGPMHCGQNCCSPLMACLYCCLYILRVRGMFRQSDRTGSVAAVQNCCRRRTCNQNLSDPSGQLTGLSSFIEQGLSKGVSSARCLCPVHLRMVSSGMSLHPADASHDAPICYFMGVDPRQYACSRYVR